MEYPWYDVVIGDNITQGDILMRCPVVSILPSNSDTSSSNIENVLEVEEIILDGVILSQACDIENGKIDNLIICPIEARSHFEDRLRNSNKNEKEILNTLKSISRGERPGLYLLDKLESKEQGVFFEHHVVEFKNLYSVPISTAKEMAKANGDRIRLLPPYSEHLSQAFARYFMRVGLPSNIVLE